LLFNETEVKCDRRSMWETGMIFVVPIDQVPAGGDALPGTSKDSRWNFGRWWSRYLSVHFFRPCQLLNRHTHQAPVDVSRCSLMQYVILSTVKIRRLHCIDYCCIACQFQNCNPRF